MLKQRDTKTEILRQQLSEIYNMQIEKVRLVSWQICDFTLLKSLSGAILIFT